LKEEGKKIRKSGKKRKDKRKREAREENQKGKRKNPLFLLINLNSYTKIRIGKG